jgi:hypothetical protein
LVVVTTYIAPLQVDATHTTVVGGQGGWIAMAEVPEDVQRWR